MIADVLRRCSLAPVAAFILSALVMANHVYDVGPDSIPPQIKMARWLIHGAPVFLLTVLIEVGRIAWARTSTHDQCQSGAAPSQPPK